MALQTVVIDEKKKTITIVLDLEKPRLSKSEKTLIVGSSKGGVKSTAMVGGKTVVITASAYVKP